MMKFTEAYQKARSVITSQTFGWEKFLKTEAPVPSLLAAKGPDTIHSSVGDKVRKKIDDKKRGAFARFFLGDNEGTVIWEAAGNGSAGSQVERAATIKFVNGLYRIEKRGAQDVWVYNPAKKYEGWVFDEVKGSASACKKKLGYKAELFSETEMKHMSAALHVALAASQKTCSKLAKPDDDIKKMVRDWFCDDHGSEAQLTKAMTKLKAGMAKIVSLCNSNTLVFTDLPSWRASREKYFGGAYRGGEGGGFPVIYLEGCFTKLAGNSGKMWLCAETIVHEASHHEVSTQDHFYDHHGLKPSSNKFPVDKALDNADNWGYFAIDMDGKLSNSDRTRVLKTPS